MWQWLLQRLAKQAQQQEQLQQQWHQQPQGKLDCPQQVLMRPLWTTGFCPLQVLVPPACLLLLPAWTPEPLSSQQHAQRVDKHCVVKVF
jgi:hypothetical protein